MGLSLVIGCSGDSAPPAGGGTAPGGEPAGAWELRPVSADPHWYPVAVAFTADGTLWATWAEMVGLVDAEVFVGRWDGQVWDAESLGMGYGSDLIAHGDQLHLVWRAEESLGISYRRHDGTAWQAPTTISDPADGFAAYPRMAVNERGDVGVAYVAHDTLTETERIEVVALGDGVAATAPAIAGEHGGDGCDLGDLVVDAEGAMFVSWACGQADLFGDFGPGQAARVHDGLVTPIALAASNSPPALALGPDGGLLAAVVDHPNGCSVVTITGGLAGVLGSLETRRVCDAFAIQVKLAVAADRRLLIYAAVPTVPFDAYGIYGFGWPDRPTAPIAETIIHVGVPVFDPVSGRAAVGVEGAVAIEPPR